MWKKILIVCAALLMAISIAYGYCNQNLIAATGIYRAGGNVTGRINKAPGNISVKNVAFQKGDRILMGTTNPELNEPVELQLISKSTYTSYNCSNYKQTCNKTVPITSWLASTTKAIGHSTTGITAADYVKDPIYYTSTGGDSYSKYAPFASSKLYTVMYSFNETIHEKDKAILTYPNTGEIIPKLLDSSMAKEATVASAFDVISIIFNKKSFYLLSSKYLGLLTEAKDTKFNERYWGGTFLARFPNPVYTNAFVATGTGRVISYGDQAAAGISSGLDRTGYNYALRPFTDVDLTKTVFGISRGSTNDKAKITVPTLPASYTALYSDAVGSPMKLRVENSALTASTALNQIENDSNAAISKTVADKTVYLNANAQAGNDGGGGIYTVSALIFNDSGDFLYYKPLEAAKGSGSYALDLTGIPIGKYKIGIVNEAYDENSTAPADSSAITSVLSLEIVKPVSITATPKTGLEAYKNVNQNDIVATYTTKDGADPISTTLVSDTSVGGHENDYQLFSVSNGNVVVNNPTGLHAGDYYFKLNAVDSNGDPTGGVNSATVHISVAKTSLSVAFDDSNQTKKSVTEATAGWNEPATATPIDGVKITYEKVSGDIGLIDIDPDTGAITYKGSGAYGKVTIRATADDDSSSGYDDYNPITATKEIIIYAEVNGSVTPHANSSDINTPTFTANDPNVKTGGTIGIIQGAPGTPDNVTGSTFTYTYGLKSDGDGSFFAVNASTGAITTKANLSVGSYHITVTVSDKWSTKEIPVTINVGVAQAEDLKFYETSAAINAITTKSAKITDTNVTVYATVKGSSNPNQVTYKIKDGSTNVIEVNNNGDVKINGVGTVTIVAEKKGASGQADAQAELTFTVTAGAQNFIYTDNAGNELPKSGTVYNAYQEVYEPSKTFQLYTAGNPTGSTVTYQLKVGSPTDVISVDGNGLVTVLNASISPSQIGRVIVEATSHDPTGNYSDKTIELPINITKAKQAISFKEITYVSNGKGSVAPIINEQDISSSEGGVSVPDTSYYISVDTSITNNIAYTNDGITIHYDYTGEDGIDIPLHVVKAGNRNYEKAEADGTLHIMSPDENILATTNMGKIVYGDHFEIRSLQDDSSSTNVQYQFEVDNTTYISNPIVSGNKAEFDALKVSGKTNITIKVTRTADGETPLSKNISVQVLPKEIEIIIDDQEKYKGEQNPVLTYQDFRNQLVSWNGVQDIIQENDIKLSTTAKTDSSAGTYPIKGDSNSLNKTYSNYSFTFKEGTLTIKEENIEDDWYHLEIDDGNNTAYTGNWTNQNVNIISDHSEYINLSLDQSTWNPTKVTVSKEGETNQSFWMKKDSGAITKEKQETIKIDKTAPKVKGIKAKDTNNKLQDIINKLSGGIFFKPGTAFEITTDDSKDDLKVSGTKEIAYKVYKIEQQARSIDELIKEGNLTVTNEKASITISETTGSYKVCVTPSDNAGNTNSENCHEVELKKIDVVVDNDGKPDFNDPNGDGCPDLNIKWKDPNDSSKWIIINGDRDGDGIPDLNIDSDGDGKPDLNIDTDHDGKPDLNLVILKKAEWKPSKCVKQDIDNGIFEEYCTGTSGKAVINVDIDGDRIPDINIDTSGDMKADINIDTDGDNKANVNIAPPHTEWKPNKDYSYGEPTFIYDTINKYEPLINIDTDGDGRPDVNIDLDGDGVADINIDTDGDRIPNINIDSTGDGKPDINVDLNDDGKPDENIKEITEWKPTKNVDGDLPYDTMDFDEPNKPDEPTNPDEPKQPTDLSDDKDVKGYYYPGKNVGGAMTGDRTNMLFLCILNMLSLGILMKLYKREYADD